MEPLLIATSPSNGQSESRSELIIEIKGLHAQVARLKHQVDQCRQQVEDAQVTMMKPEFTQNLEAAERKASKGNLHSDAAAAAFWERLQRLLDTQETFEESREAKLTSRLDKLLDQQCTGSAKVSKSTDTRPPIKFKDAVGRKFSFPYHLCETWAGLEKLILDAFEHVDMLGQHVKNGQYDLLNASGEIIVRSIWEEQIEPGMHLNMAMWPMSPPPPPLPLPTSLSGPPPKPSNRWANSPPTGGARLPIPPPPPRLFRPRNIPFPLPKMGEPPVVNITPRPPQIPPPPPPMFGLRSKKGKKKRGMFRGRSPSMSSISDVEMIRPKKTKGWGLWQKFKALFRRKPKPIRLMSDTESDSDDTVMD